ncbi:MAG: glutathione S-transferase N-terminal domain-containing protein [Roseivivax sp.]|nr:glutathione S-transferase N-terminal domain-containing protein [Roseivivax sp.]
MTAPIDFYFWPTPNGWKISIALEEFALPYTTHLVNIGAGDQHRPEFLAISPNNKMPAIVDPDGPDGAPVSIFESGAILLYLAEKHGKFDGVTAREKIAVREWLMWQMGGVGPMAGQAHHFLKFAPEDIPYAKRRYVEEVERLYGVLDERLASNRFVAGPNYTIADMAIWGWASLWEGQNQTLDDKPHMARWLDEVFARPAVKRGRKLHMELRKGPRDRYAKQLMG